METKLKQMTIKAVGKKMGFNKPNSLATNSMCSAKAKDQQGVEHKAYAFGNLCDTLEVGSKVLVTKKSNNKILKKEENESFLIIKKIG
jgi:hypothetical protein